LPHHFQQLRRFAESTRIGRWRESKAGLDPAGTALV
jgi:hypothetical protein